jgi:hypothetical protein
MMSRIPVQPRALFARTLCVALAGAIVTASAPAMAAPVPLLTLAPDGAPGTVLGLDGKDANASNNLTNALRKAFANRGISGGEEISLEEMRLTMGCANDEVSCLAQGGKTLGVRRLVFGYLRPGGGGYTLEIQILDVEGGRLEAQASIAVSKAELAADKIDAKATAIVNELIPPEKTDADLPPRPDPLPETDTTEQGEPKDEPPPEKESNVYFGLEKPTPRWKWGAFGTSLALTVLAGGATIGMGVWLTSKNGGFRGKLLDEANASLTDDNPLNDVDPTMPETSNLCEYAKTRPTDENGNPLGMPGQVRNSKVVKVCNDADDVRTAQIGAGVGTAVFGLATLVFTGVLLIHKRKPGADAMLRHGVRLGVAPTREGGLTIAGGLRF